jgi:hypothetical protein
VRKGGLLHGCYSLLLDRDRHSLKSSWKRKGDLTNEQLKSLNDALASFFKNQNSQIDLQDRRERLAKDDVLVVIHHFTPYKRRLGTQESLMSVKTASGVKPASQISPIIRSLLTLWEEDVHVHAAKTLSSALGRETIVRALTQPMEPTDAVRVKPPLDARRMPNV